MVTFVTTVNMFEAKTKLSKLVEAVESGAEQEIIIARNGKPAARIVPIETRPANVSKRLGIADGEFGDLSSEAMAEWDKLDDEIWKGFWEEPLLPERPQPKSGGRKKSA
jgi:prevent-host-death family protein